MREKRWAAVLILCVAAAFGFGMAGKNSWKNIGLPDVETVSDLLALPCFQAGMIGYNREDARTVEEKTYEGFRTNQERYVETLTGAPVIVRVSPTERLLTAGDGLGQEFLVEEVIRGEESIQAGESYFVYASGVFRIEREKIYSETAVNLMRKDREYLLFLQPSGLNPYQVKQEFWWYDTPLLSCVCLEDTVLPLTVSDLERPCSELQEYTFFAYSDRIAQVIGAIRGRLAAYFCPEYRP